MRKYATLIDKLGYRQLLGAILAVGLFLLLLALDRFRWELLGLSHRNAAHNAAFNLGIAPLLLGSVFITCAFVVGGVLGNWDRIALARNKYLPLILTIPLIAFVLLRFVS